jgi:hypothetical protein
MTRIASAHRAGGINEIIEKQKMADFRGIVLCVFVRVPGYAFNGIRDAT